MADQMFLTEEVKQKWAPVIDHKDLPPIKESWKKRVTTILLENTARELRNVPRVLTESTPDGVPANYAGAFPRTNLQGFDPILISLIRRSMPNLIAYDICGVQPMTGPTGLIFALKSLYTGQDSAAEALYYEANTTFSGGGLAAYANGDTAAHTGTHPAANSTGLPGEVNNYTYSPGMSTLQGESLGPQVRISSSGNVAITANTIGIPEMAFSIDKVTVTAVTRKLKAEYTIEIAQDLKAVHGLDAETELANILSAEILAEINREIVRTVYFTSKIGANNNVGTVGIFNLDSDSDGRWMVERFKGMFFQIEREANAIAKNTRRGKGNILICSSDVASALAAADILHYQSAYDANLQVDDMGSTFAGTLQGRYKVYIDPYAPLSNYQYFVVGFRGASPYDAGLFYCPYVPLQMLRAQDPNSFQPKIGFQTRYGVVANPFSNLTGTSNGQIVFNTNEYYRKVLVTNLM